MASKKEAWEQENPEVYGNPAPGKGNAVIGQSGGPTSVINSSLAGVIREIQATGLAENIYGMNFGIKGLMEERLIALGRHPAHVLDGLRTPPSPPLGSSRHKVSD